MKKSVFFITMVLVTFACSKPIYESTKLNIRLTDAPAEYREVWVDIDSIKILYLSSELSGEWLSLENVQKGLYNLLDYQNGRDTLIATSDLATGTIMQIRLILGENNSLVTSDGTFDLKVPSGETSGLKIKVNKVISGGENNVIFLDFNVDKSIVEKGNGTYSLKPLIRVYSGDNSGSVEGKISPKESNSRVSIELNSEIIETITDPNGYFCLRGVPEGVYNLLVTPNVPYLGKTIENTVILGGGKINLGTISLEKGEVFTALSFDGDLNINPSTSQGERFEMQTVGGQIDIATLAAEGDSFIYNGSATEVSLIPKAQGATVTVNGSDIMLNKDLRYTFASNGTVMTVNLRNTKGGNGNWWIQISGESISILPSPN